MILPNVKEEINNGIECILPTRITYSYEKGNQEAELAAMAFASFFPAAEYLYEDAFVKFTFDKSLAPKDEIYSITVLSDGINARFRDKRGAVNAAATISGLLCKSHIYQGSILDYPKCEYRSLMIDMARGLPSFEDIEASVKYMALAKFNRLHLHLMDSKGPCYISEALPEYRYAGEGDACSKDFLRDIAKLCSSYAIDIVPEIGG